MTVGQSLSYYAFLQFRTEFKGQGFWHLCFYFLSVLCRLQYVGSLVGRFGMNDDTTDETPELRAVAHERTIPEQSGILRVLFWFSCFLTSCVRGRHVCDANDVTETSTRELGFLYFRARSTSENPDPTLRHRAFTAVFPEFKVGIPGISENLRHIEGSISPGLINIFSFITFSKIHTFFYLVKFQSTKSRCFQFLFQSKTQLILLVQFQSTKTVDILIQFYSLTHI